MTHSGAGHDPSGDGRREWRVPVQADELKVLVSWYQSRCEAGPSGTVNR